MQISVDIPASLKSALEEKAGTRGGVSAVVTAALARYLEKPIHTIFQVSTSGALVAGVYESEVSVRTLLEHGDFGLGTFADLDGEMVVVDGRAYQIQGSGSVSEALSLAPTPFQSGGMDRDRRINRAGNSRARKTLVQLAWLWLRYQPESSHAAWFRDRVGSLQGRIRRITIVALARKLLIAIWRFVTLGLAPEGAIIAA